MIYGLDLMVFCLRDEDLKNDKIGLDTHLDNCVLRLFTFYNIDYICLDRDNPEYTCIGSGGSDFTCNEEYEVVKHKINQLNVLRLN